jgi:hypothetical protein
MILHKISNEVMKNQFNKGKDANFFFYRDKPQRKVA